MTDEPRTPASIRQARLKSALRDNLRRRKAQARDRDGARPETVEPTPGPPEDGSRDP